MKIIKRNGAEVPFDITKIITAVTKASDSVGGQARLSREQITQIAAAVTDQCQQLNRAVSVEEVQDLVENQLMDIQAHDVARHYITYRYVQSLKRQTNTTDERILSLIECQNEEVKQENANKNPTVNSVQRDYMADEILVAFVLRVHGDRFVAEQRLRTGRRDDNVLSAIGCRVTDFPEMSVFLFRLHFDVRHRGLQLRIPVHETGALVDQALAVQLDEGLPDNARKLFIHREVGALPIHGVTEAAHLLQNRAAGEFLPLEHFLHELFAGEGVGDRKSTRLNSSH